MTQSLNQVLYEELQAIRSEAWALRHLAAAFEQTGNTYVARNLERAAESLEKSAARISEAYGQHLHEDVKAAEQASGNMLGALLAVSRLQSEAASRIQDKTDGEATK